MKALLAVCQDDWRRVLDCCGGPAITSRRESPAHNRCWEGVNINEAPEVHVCSQRDPLISWRLSDTRSDCKANVKEEAGGSIAIWDTNVGASVGFSCTSYGILTRSLTRNGNAIHNPNGREYKQGTSRSEKQKKKQLEKKTLACMYHRVKENMLKTHVSVMSIKFRNHGCSDNLTAIFDLNRNYFTTTMHRMYIKSWILQILQSYIRHTVQPSKFRYRLERRSKIHWPSEFFLTPDLRATVHLQISWHKSPDKSQFSTGVCPNCLSQNVENFKTEISSHWSPKSMKNEGTWTFFFMPR